MAAEDEKTTLIPQSNIGYSIRDVRIEPGVVLAPMEGVTDIVFRRVIRDIGDVGLTYTEFVASKDVAAKKGRGWDMAQFDPDEKPIALQIFGRDPAIMAEAAKVLEDMGATMVDINMGCPSKRVCQKSGGSALMKEPELATEIVRQCRAAIKIPLTVKMRSGFDHGMRNAPELAKRFESEGAEGITIHWRTRADLYGGERAIDKIREAVDVVSIPVIANGDIVDVPTAKQMLDDTGCAGLMIGRGAIRNPWVFREVAAWLRGEEPPVIKAAERRHVLLNYFDEILRALGTEKRAIGRMKMVMKHFGDILPQGKILRRQVLRSKTVTQARQHTELYFDMLDAHEAGDEAAFADLRLPPEDIAEGRAA